MQSSRSVALLRAVDDFPLAFLSDGRASRLICHGVFISKTACLGSIFGERPRHCQFQR